jgi:hypothetical protein
MNVYLLFHDVSQSEQDDHVSVCGVFSSEEKAVEAIRPELRHKLVTDGAKKPASGEFFYVEKWEVDQTT